MAKYHHLAELLEKRILHGDYALSGLPSSEKLAEETGVVPMTARRALIHLAERGLAIRRPNGRIELNPAYEQTTDQPSLAFLAPAWMAPNIDRWRTMLKQALAQTGHALRPIDFVHWDDPVIGETLAKFRGVFLLPSAEPIPPSIMQRFADTPQLVVLEHDLSAHGIVSVNFYPTHQMQTLFEYVSELGWRDLACLNIQPNDSVIQARIERWQSYCWLSKVEGQLHNHPVPPNTPTLEHAYKLVGAQALHEKLAGRAVFCTTMAAALGAGRALHEAGLKIGRDVALFTFNGEDLHRYMTPTVCCLEPQQPMELLARCVDWLGSPQPRAWEGPRLLEPLQMKLFAGESVTRRVAQVFDAPSVSMASLV